MRKLALNLTQFPPDLLALIELFLDSPSADVRGIICGRLRLKAFMQVPA
jgi:hypothetical protein